MNIELKRIDRTSFPMGILDLAVQSDQSRAFAACMDGVYAIEFAAKPEESEAKPKVVRIGKHDSFVSGVALLEEHAELISTSFDGTFHVRRLTDIHADVQPHIAERIHSFWSWDMALSPNHALVASVTGQYLPGSEEYSPAPSAESTVKILEARTGKLMYEFTMLPPVQCVAFDPSSRYVSAANLMGDVAIWDVTNGQQVTTWRSPQFTSWGIIKSHCYIGGINAIAFSPDSQTVLIAGMGDMRDPMAGNGKQLWHRFAWQKDKPELTQQVTASESGEGLMEALAWHPSGRYFDMAGRLRGGNWNLGIFDGADGKLIGQAKTGMRITTVKFSQDGQNLYLAGMQGQPQPKDGHFPDFGYLERYAITVKDN